MPGFEYLQNVLFNCWNLLKCIDQKFVKRGNELIWINEDIKRDKDNRVVFKKQQNYQPECLVQNRREFTCELLHQALKDSIKNEDKCIQKAQKQGK